MFVGGFLLDFLSNKCGQGATQMFVSALKHNSLAFSECFLSPLSPDCQDALPRGPVVGIRMLLNCEQKTAWKKGLFIV